MTLSAEAMLRCPVGCNFLWTIVRDHAPLERALAPAEACERAAVALRALYPWTERSQEALDLALARGHGLEALAREVTAHPASQWWNEPFDIARQVLFTGRALPSRLGPDLGPSPAWEDYAERPTAWRVSSTTHDGVSSADMAMLTRVGDWERPERYQRSRAVVDPGASVFEVTSPEDWHALSAEAPREYLHDSGATETSLLVPDWARLADEYDGVHLTFGGLLTTPHVRVRSAAGTTRLRSWDAEFTIWVTDVVRAGPPLPPAATQHVERVARLRGYERGRTFRA